MYLTEKCPPCTGHRISYINHPLTGGGLLTQAHVPDIAGTGQPLHERITISACKYYWPAPPPNDHISCVFMYECVFIFVLLIYQNVALFSGKFM